MTSTLVDSNVLIDIATDDPVWSSWSAESLRRASLDGELVINSIIYGEISGAFEMIEEVDAFLDGKLYRREDVPWAAAFLASRAFRVYRRRGGGKVSPLPDFYIGGHAALLGYRLLTRDRAHFKSYFPALQILSPAVS